MLTGKIKKELHFGPKLKKIIPTFKDHTCHSKNSILPML